MPGAGTGASRLGPSTPRVWRWHGVQWGGLSERLRLLAAWVRPAGIRLLAAAWLPPVVAAAAVGYAAAVVGLTAPTDSPLAVPGTVAGLAAPIVVAAALGLAWARGEAAGRGLHVTARDLRVRGAAGWQIVVFLALATVPLLAVSVAAGAVAGLGGGIVGAHLGAGSPAAGSLRRALEGALATAVVAAVAAAASVLRPPAHNRQVSAEHASRAAFTPLDLLLLVLGWWIAHRASIVGLAPAGGGESPLVGVVAASGGTVPPWALPVGGAIFLIGAALLAGRLLHAAAALVERLWGPHLGAVAIMAARAASRATAPLRLLLVPALAAGTLVYVAAGIAGIAATDRYLRLVAVGAPAALNEDWDAPCRHCLPPGTLPDFAAAQSGLPGVAADALEVSVQDSVSSIGRRLPIQLAGVDPSVFGAVAQWPAPTANGKRLLDLLARNPGGAVISRGLAVATGLRPGDRLVPYALPNMTVIAEADAWPGLGTGDGLWAVVPWATLQAGLRTDDYYGSSSILVQVLLRLTPGASLDTLAAAIPPRAAAVLTEMVLPRADPSAVETAAQSGGLADLVSRLAPGASTQTVYANILAAMPVVTGPHVMTTPGGGAGRLPETLAPLAVLAALLFAAAIRADSGTRGLPTGNALVALAAYDETRRARRWTSMVQAGTALIAGAAAGTVAAAMFFGVAHPHFVSDWHGLWVALALILVLAPPLARAATRDRAAPGDPLVLARVATEPTHPVEVAAAGPRVLAASQSARPSGTRTAGAVIALAGRRLWAARRRLAGLAAGVLVASSVAATIPIFTVGSMTRELRGGLPLTSDRRPAGAVLVSLFPKPDQNVTATDLDGLSTLTGEAGALAGVGSSTPIAFLATDILPVTGNGSESTGIGFAQLDALAGLSAHAHFEDGVPPAGTPEADGTIDVAATDGMMAGQGYGPYLLGRVYHLSLPGGGSLKLRITGVFSERDPEGGYWPYAEFRQDFFANPVVLRDLLLTQHVAPLHQATWYTVLDLAQLNADTVSRAMHGLADLEIRVANARPGTNLEISPYGILQTFSTREHGLTALLRLASLPVLALVLYFVAITASVVVAGEAGEISVYTSRGAPTFQVLALYLAQWILLAVPLTFVAPLLGAGFARAMGSAVGFLRFTSRAPLPIVLQPRDFASAAAAAGLGVLAALLPVLAALRRSVVEARAHQSRATVQPLWQRARFDLWALALLAVAWVTLHPHGGASGPSVGAAALVGQSALYLLPAAFLLVAGLLAVRALGWLLWWFDGHGGDGAPVTVSLALRRIGRLPAQFAPLVLLLCFTTALGTYSAAAARTLAANLSAAVRYRVGADARFVQSSPCSTLIQPPAVCGAEGSGGRPPRPLPAFATNLSAPGVGDAAEMLEIPAFVDGTGRTSVAATLILVDPAAYARVAYWPANLQPRPEATYLQPLEASPQAVLLSPGVAGAVRAPGLSVTVGGAISAPIHDAGTVNRWPGADISGPFVIAPLKAASSMGVTCTGVPGTLCPGSRIVLDRLMPGADISRIDATLTSDALQNHQMDVAATEVTAALGSPEWAGQDGMLTIGFLVAVAVAATGYLLYAGLILGGQRVQLGLLRAIGLDRSTLVTSVAVEQGVLVAAGALAGELAGLAAAVLFVPLYQPAFTGADAPPFTPSGPGPAALQLALLVVALFALVLVALIWQIRRMRIGETVKLEE